jgi:hypothetical protein
METALNPYYAAMQQCGARQILVYFQPFLPIIRKRLNCSCKAIASGRLKSFSPDSSALRDQHFGRIVKALAALRAAAQRLVNRIGIARATPRGFAQFAFADGIADADIHRRLPKSSTRV